MKANAKSQLEIEHQVETLIYRELQVYRSSPTEGSTNHRMRKFETHIYGIELKRGYPY